MSIAKETAAERLLRELQARDQTRQLAAAMDGLFGHSQRAAQSASSAFARAGLGPIDKGLATAARGIVDPLGSSLSKLSLGNLSGLSSEASRIASGFVPNTPSRALPAPQITPPTPAIHAVADLGPLVRRARKAMKMSQSTFAAHAGVGRRFLSELEGGKPSLEFDKVLAVTAAAGIDILARPRRN